MLYDLLKCVVQFCYRVWMMIYVARLVYIYDQSYFDFDPCFARAAAWYYHVVGGWWLGVE